VTVAGRAESFVPTVNRVLAGAFDEGPDYATWRSRGTTDWLLFHTTAGLGRLGTEGPGGVDGPDVPARPGDTLVIRPGIRHDYGTAVTGLASGLTSGPPSGPVPTDGRWAFLYAHFHPRPEWVPLLDWPEAAPGILRLRAEPGLERRIRGCLNRAARFRTSSLPRRELLAANALEEALLWCDTQNPRQGRRLDERVLRALELVDERLPGSVNIEDLAEAATLSVSRFSHLFREQVGVAPRDYVERQRMLAAAHLLELTQRPIGSIAAEIGFDDALYFSTRFRRVMGVSPRAYRATAIRAAR